MAVMDYSLVQRIIDGTGQILDTTPGSPDSGSYVTEAQLRDWIKAGILFSGYYYNGSFYSDSGHTSPLAKVEGALYVDKTNSNKALYVCLSSTYQSLTEEAQVQAIIDGLNDGTIVPLKAKQDQNGNVIDTTYETKADANDLKNALTAVDHRVQNLESAKGDYVPVDSDKGVISVPSGKGKWAVVEKLRGVTRASNQLATRTLSKLKYYNGSGTWNDNVYTLNGLSFTVNGDGSITVTGTASTTTAFWVTNNIQGGTSHSYFIAGCPSGGSTTSYMLGSNVMGMYDVGSGVIFTIGGTTHPFIIRIYRDYAISGSVTFMPVVRDLTLYFGSTVPTLAEIQQYYPWLLEPSDYGSSLVDSGYEGVKSTSPYNIWNEEWELGRYDNSTGEKISASTSIRSKDFTYVEPNDRLYVICPSIGMRIFFYGINKNFVSTQIIYNTSDFTIASGVYYFTFQTGNDGNPITTYGNNIQFCPYSYTEERDTYHHHLLDTLSLPTPITLRSAGSVAEEAYLNEDGKAWKTNPIKTIDLGTDINNWAYDSTYDFFYVSLSDKAYDAEFTCSGYVNVGARTDPQMADVPTMSCSTNGGGWFYIKNTSKNGSDIVGGVCSWLNGVILNYHLLTPNAPTQLDPIQNPTILTESGGTISAQTEEPIDGNFSVGFITL